MIRLMEAFTMAPREGIFSGPTHGTLVESTIQGAISYVSQTFTEDDQPNPTKYEDSKTGRVLSRNYRAYKNSNPNPKQQNSIPICGVAEVFKKKAIDTQRAMSHLEMGGLLYACRLCKYLMIPQAEQRRTYIMSLRCVRFFKDIRELQHSDPYLEYADCVSITF